ncbi:MAG: chlorophyll synthesis pathway protein BchC, partial [Devosiaceae bacterium]|nr:chlorophyll synthesis pathway protein BchC [Devosiaceae bacterium MH13]
MTTTAVVLQAPEKLALCELPLSAPSADDLVVDVAFSGISTGTERLLWSGEMPPFPGMGYPLVPGYESVGTVVDAGKAAANRIGERVFVPGARCYGEVHGLFGGASRRVVLPSERAPKIDEETGSDAVLLALAATAYHSLAQPDARPPELIVGHGVLGRLLARIACALFEAPPVVWETNADRRSGAAGYAVLHPDEDTRADYGSIYDVSGAPDMLDTLIGRLGRGGEVVLAGFYSQPLQFAFPPAFMREARIRVAAEWRPADLSAVQGLIA